MKHVLGAGIGLVIGVLSWVLGFGLIVAGFMAGDTPGIVLFLIGTLVIGAGTMVGRKLLGRQFI